MREEKTVPKVSSCKALERKEHCGDWKHGFIESETFMDKKGRNRALCAESARLASIQRAVRTMDGHKARSPRILFVLFKRSLRLQWRREGEMPHARNIKAETE